MSVFKFFATIRFAIPVLSLFTFAMIYGTFCESLHGTSYANRVVYHSVWFYMIQGALAMSLTFSMIDRLPFKKKLMGFYTVHISLLILLGGAVVTRYTGIDGALELSKNEYRASIKLHEDQMTITNGKQEYSLKMPVAVSPQKLSQALHFIDETQVVLEKFLPFAKPEHQFKKKEGTWSSQWMLVNDRFQMPLNFSLGAEGVPPRISEGPLTLEVLPEPVFKGLMQFLVSAHANYLLLDVLGDNFYPIQNVTRPLLFKIRKDTFKLERAHNKKANISFFRLTSTSNAQNKILHFIPRFSSEPFTNHLETLPSVPFRLYELSETRKKPTVFFSRFQNGSIHIAFGKGFQWTTVDYQGTPVLLPWMNFQLKLMHDWGEAIPEVYFTAGTPHKEEGKNIKAALLKIQKGTRSEEIWITDRQTTRSQIANLEGIIQPEEIHLPFQLKLEQFKMDQIPGTDKPASYESFVKEKNSSTMHHIYMNHPLKKEGFTLYQASYFQDEQGEFHSVLSVNKDPGRPIKYLGSLLLVLGLLLHFSIIYGYIRFQKA